MIPILYEKTEHSFSTHGLGSIPVWRELTVTEERADGENGEFFLEGFVPIGSRNSDQIAVERIISCAPAPERAGYSPMQPFRIRRVTKEGNFLHVLAQHVSVELRENIMAPVGFAESAVWSTVQDMFDALFNSTVNNYVFPPVSGRFSFASDIVPTQATQVDMSDPMTVRAWLSMVQGIFGGEFDFDGFSVTLNGARGQSRGVEIAYGKNLDTLEYVTDTEGLVTGYYCYCRKNNGYKGAIAYSDNVSDFAYPRVVSVDLSEQFETVPTDQQMQAAADAYAAAQNDNYIPTSITVTAVPAEFQKVWLCDTVTVVHPVYQLRQTAKVVKTVFDPIREKYTAVTIGEIQTRITDTIAAILKGGNYSAKRARI